MRVAKADLNKDLNKRYDRRSVPLGMEKAVDVSQRVTCSEASRRNW